MKWRPITEIPRQGVPILMRGPSGYIAPNDVRYNAGYYDAEYRPHMPWREFDNDAITDGGPMPREWCYRDEVDQ